MTRNNLNEHLSWLLSTAGISLSAPANSARPSHETSSQGREIPKTQRKTARPAEIATPYDVYRNSPTLPARKTSTDGVPAQREPEARHTFLGSSDNDMARLELQKPKKPSLVAKQKQLLTPASTTTSGRFEQAYTQSLKAG